MVEASPCPGEEVKVAEVVDDELEQIEKAIASLNDQYEQRVKEDWFHLQSNDEMPQLIKKYIGRVAANGRPLFDWAFVKTLFAFQTDVAYRKICQKKDANPVNDDLESCFNEKERIKKELLRFDDAPFSIQRICELLLQPDANYKRPDKYLRALEKNVSVVTTVDREGRRNTDTDNVHLNGAAYFSSTETDYGLSSATLKNCPPPDVPNSQASAESLEGQSSAEVAAANAKTPVPSIEALWHSTLTSSGATAALSELCIGTRMNADNLLDRWKVNSENEQNPLGESEILTEELQSTVLVATASDSEDAAPTTSSSTTKSSKRPVDQRDVESPWKRPRAAPLDD